jgi:transposase
MIETLHSRHIDVLFRWSRGAATPRRLAVRSRIVLLHLHGMTGAQIRRCIGVSATTVRLWVGRFERGGAAALARETPGRGRKRAVPPSLMREELQRSGLLKDDGTAVSLRKAAARLGVSATAVWRAQRRWSAFAAPDRPSSLE